MIVKDRLYDNRINSLNILIEIELSEYYELSKDILKNNELQRRRVGSSSSIYNLLKSDLRQGCVIPPIVLALAVDAKPKIDETNEKLVETINNQKEKLIILDGLQRTYTIRDLVNELYEKNDPDTEKILKNKLRVEVYLGINKLGILYRMLTLNTGQTPMSSRHQIEIIYSDYLREDIDGIRLLKEVDDQAPTKLGEYKFRDIIDGFTSYLDRDYLSLDRTDILDNIKSLEKLATENQDSDLFRDFLTSYDLFVKKIHAISNGWTLDEDNTKLTGQAFGKDTLKIFNKSQVMTGFGSALGKLLDFKLINEVKDVNVIIGLLKDDKIEEDLNTLVTKLDDIRVVAKKIGNDQRMYFHFFFRELFDKKADGYLDIGKSINEAFTQYERKTQ